LPVHEDVPHGLTIHPRDQKALFPEGLVRQIIGMRSTVFTGIGMFERCQILARYLSDIRLAHLDRVSGNRSYATSTMIGASHRSRTRETHKGLEITRLVAVFFAVPSLRLDRVSLR
jgi:hypothetical protein